MNTRRILNATAAVLLATIIGRVLGALREVVIARHFGTGPTMDAFFVASRIPDVLYNGLITSLVATPFIPVFAALVAQKPSGKYWRFFGSILNLLVITTVLCAVVLVAGSDFVITAIAPGLADSAHGLAANLIRIMIPVIVFGAVTGLLKSALNTFSRFGVPALVPVIYNCAVIGSLLLFAERTGIAALAYGILCAALAQPLILLPSLARCGAKYTPTLDLRDPEVRMVVRLFWPVLASLLIGQAGTLVEIYIVSYTATGAISFLSYGLRLFNLPQQFYFVVVSSIVFPLISQRASVDDQDAVARFVAQVTTVTMLTMIPATILMFGLARDIVSLVLERGAFDHGSTEGTMLAFRAYACGLPYWCLTNLIPFAFFAMKKNTLMLKITAVFWGINIVFDVTLVALISYSGIAWATTITVFIQSLVFAVMLTRLLPGVAGVNTGAGSWPMIAASAILLSLAFIGCAFAASSANTLLERVLVTGSIALTAAGILGGLLWWAEDDGLSALRTLVIRGFRDTGASVLKTPAVASGTQRK